MESVQKIIEAPDVLIVGGGIVGSAILRECAKNGLTALLAERRDFGWDVSAGSTEMAHGGFRYLMALADWPLVFESLTERELLSINAPHLVRHLNFYMPVYRGDGTTFDFCIPYVPCMPITVGSYFGVGMWMMQAGMILYKLFAMLGLKMKGFPPNKEKVGYRKYNKGNMLRISPELRSDGLVGGFKFTDCKIEDVERLVMENILSAEQYAGGDTTKIAALNYTEAVSFKKHGYGGKIDEVILRDTITGETRTVKPRLVVNSTGVLIDETVKKVVNNTKQELIRKVSGVHLVVPRFIRSEDLTEAYAFWIDKKILFLISKGRDRMLVGTTERDIEIEEDGNHNRNFRSDLEQVARKAKDRFPLFEFDRDSHVYYTRVRPLKQQPSHSDPKAVSRRDLVKWHDDYPNINMVSVSGKLGPARHLAEVVTRKIVSKLKPGSAYSFTHRDRYAGGNLDCDIDEYARRRSDAWPEIESRLIENIVRRYGSRYEGVLDLAREPRDLERISGRPDSLPLCALLFSFVNEHCRRLADAMVRTGSSKLFGEGLDGIAEAADYVGGKLGWSAERIAEEIDFYRQFIAERRALVND